MLRTPNPPGPATQRALAVSSWLSGMAAAHAAVSRVDGTWRAAAAAAAGAVLVEPWHWAVAAAVEHLNNTPTPEDKRLAEERVAARLRKRRGGLGGGVAARAQARLKRWASTPELGGSTFTSSREAPPKRPLSATSANAPPPAVLAFANRWKHGSGRSQRGGLGGPDDAASVSSSQHSAERRMHAREQAAAAQRGLLSLVHDAGGGGDRGDRGDDGGDEASSDVWTSDEECAAALAQVQRRHASLRAGVAVAARATAAAPKRGRTKTRDEAAAQRHALRAARRALQAHEARWRVRGGDWGLAARRVAAARRRGLRAGRAMGALATDAARQAALVMWRRLLGLSRLERAAWAAADDAADDAELRRVLAQALRPSPPPRRRSSRAVAATAPLSDGARNYALFALLATAVFAPILCLAASLSAAGAPAAAAFAASAAAAAALCAAAVPRAARAWEGGALPWLVRRRLTLPSEEEDAGRGAWAFGEDTGAHHAAATALLSHLPLPEKPPARPPGWRLRAPAAARAGLRVWAGLGGRGRALGGAVAVAGPALAANLGLLAVAASGSAAAAAAAAAAAVGASWALGGGGDSGGGGGGGGGDPCAICLERGAVVALSPCGHVACCDECAGALRDAAAPCPRCAVQVCALVPGVGGKPVRRR